MSRVDVDPEECSDTEPNDGDCSPADEPKQLYSIWDDDKIEKVCKL